MCWWNSTGYTRRGWWSVGKRRRIRWRRGEKASCLTKRKKTLDLFRARLFPWLILSFLLFSFPLALSLIPHLCLLYCSKWSWRGEKEREREREFALTVTQSRIAYAIDWCYSHHCMSLFSRLLEWKKWVVCFTLPITSSIFFLLFSLISPDAESFSVWLVSASVFLSLFLFLDSHCIPFFLYTLTLNVIFVLVRSTCGHSLWAALNAIPCASNKKKIEKSVKIQRLFWEKERERVTLACHKLPWLVRERWAESCSLIPFVSFLSILLFTSIYTLLNLNQAVCVEKRKPIDGHTHTNPTRITADFFVTCF